MPRRTIPGPKSKTQNPKNQQSKKSSFLADSTSTEDADNESFACPELEGEYTDYNLEYSISPHTSKRKNPAPQLRPANQRKQNSSTVNRKSPRSSTAQTSQRPTQFLSQKKPRKQLTPQRRDRLLWKEIKSLQGRTDNLTPKAPFGRLIRELLLKHSSDVNRITYTALEALQSSSELYLTQLFGDAYVCTLHRGRVTLGIHDIRLVRYLRGLSDPGNK